jgi:hypothetical protein
MSNTKGKRIFRYRLSLETFGYTLAFISANSFSSCRSCTGEYPELTAIFNIIFATTLYILIFVSDAIVT